MSSVVVVVVVVVVIVVVLWYGWVVVVNPKPMLVTGTMVAQHGAKSALCKCREEGGKTRAIA